MIFTSGIALGIFVNGVSEPLLHQQSNFYKNQGYHSQDEVDMFGINLAITHWGIAGWSSYTLVAIAMSLARWRFGLPTSFRSIFYPIMGDYVFGWSGDVIDGVAILVTIAGICSGLGLGAQQLLDGFRYLGWVDEINSVDRFTSIENVIAWWLTVCTILVVVTGINKGIKSLSLVSLVLGLGFILFILCADDTKFIMNLQVQELGE
jgi:choline-glycine betaine transporter